MRLPSKITSYSESVISKFPAVLSVLHDADTGVLALYEAATKHFSSIEEFMDTRPRQKHISDARTSLSYRESL